MRPRPAYDRLAHIGFHPQKQPGLNWVGVVLPVGKMTADADARHSPPSPREPGDGDIRLTVWQNLLISGIPDAKVEDVKARSTAIGLDWTANSVRAGLVACTGSRGCKFATSDTKGHALEIAEHVETRLTLDQPVNIHLTGCPNSCAQHYIGDIGLLGAKVAVGEDDQVEGYHILSAAGSAPTPPSAATDLLRRDGRGRAAGASSACSRRISPIGPIRPRVLRFCPTPRRGGAETHGRGGARMSIQATPLPAS